jgi:hypothetical protein
MRLVRMMLVIALATGCGTSATVVRSPQYGGPVEAPIAGGDRENVYLAGSQGRVAIPRAQIQGIDHPGNTLLMTGTLLALLGTLGLSLGVLRGNDEGCPNTVCVGWAGDAVLIGSGLIMTTWGAITWGRSNSAADEGLPRPGGPPLGPR